MSSNNNNGAEGAAKGVTSTVSNLKDNLNV